MASTRHAVSVAPRLSVIVLVYNDDGSRDGSTERLGQLAARDRHVRVVSFRRNFGQTAAVQAGIDHSRGDILIFMDGDMQNDPHDIPRLLEKIDGERHRFLPVYASWVGARITELPVHHRHRTSGQSKCSLSRTLRVLLD